MLSLLVPGVLMGGSPSDAPVGAVNHLLPLMGVGRVLFPFILVVQGVSKWLTT